MSKISVIGAGNVGATILNDLMVQGIGTELVIVDINEKKAKGEAMDVYQGSPFQIPTVVRSGGYSEIAESDIVVVTCGMARKPGMSRLDLAQTNVNIIKDVAKQAVQYAPDAVYIIVSNPVDVLTYAFIKASGIPEKQVIGSGTILDTSRLKAELGHRLCISPKHVHAHVYGEHGDSSFVPWSLATVANCRIDEFKNISPNKADIHWNRDYEEMEEFVKKSGAQIIENKGATFYAVAMAVCQICKRVLSDVPSALTVSTMMHGEYGLEDVCLSVLCLVGREGIFGTLAMPLTEVETAKLHASAEKLKSVIRQVNI